MTNLKRIIDKKGVQQRWLAEQVGVTEVSMSRYISGKRIPKAPIAVRMADVLGVDVKELYGWDDEHVVGESEQPETHEKRTETHGVCLDAISRQAAIEVLGVFTQTDVLGHTPKQIVEALPSTQPEQTNSWCINSWCIDCKEYDTESKCCHRYNRVIKQTLDEVYAHAETEAEARFHAQQRWIPCSERLPEKPEQVLIYAWNVHYVLAKYKEIRTWEGIYKMAWVVEDAYNAPHEIKHDVIAWMPLLEPYREGAQE